MNSMVLHFFRDSMTVVVLVTVELWKVGRGGGGSFWSKVALGRVSFILYFRFCNPKNH